MKYIYKVIFLIAVFFGSVYFMSRNIREISVNMDKAVAMPEAELPVVTMETQGFYMNLLHGYSSNLSEEQFRENVTPIDGKKEFAIHINENETPVIRLKYEVRDLEMGQLMENNTISALSQDGDEKYSRIKLSCTLEQGKEYTIKITLTTEKGRKVYYYTRFKYYEEGTSIKKKLDFVQSIHEAALKKEEGWKELAIYMEPDPGNDENSLSRVNIHSSLSQMTWGNIVPEIVSNIVPQVTEYTIETASVVYDYYVKADAGSGKQELYKIKECFRVRYNQETLYLLDYERTMEAKFDADLASISKSEFKIGISDKNNIDIITSSDNGKVAFIRQGELWYYNLAENKAVRVFTFLSDKNQDDYIRSSFDQHNIRVTNMADNGEMDFLVYGYINRGDYEGKVGIILYHFYPEELRIKEQAYIPVDIPYQRLKESLDSFGYVNNRGDFYFSIEHVIYQYNIIARRLEVLAENVNESNFVSVQGKEGHFIAWIDSTDPAQAGSMTFLDLDTEERNTFSAPEGCVLKLYTSIDENVVFGYAKKKDIVNTIDGGLLVPCYELCIADKNRNILKTYPAGKYFVTGVSKGDNVLLLERVVYDSVNKRYRTAKSDSIINRIIDDEDGVTLSTRVTETAQSEWYLRLPSGFEMVEKPKVEVTRNTVITVDTTLRLPSEENTADEYYVYAYGEIAGLYSDIGDAVMKADECMGNVIWNGNVLWERGSKAILANITGIVPEKVPEGADSVSVCISLLLKNENINKQPGEIYSQGYSIYTNLSRYLDNVYNLTGCDLEQVLYYVGKGCPVVAINEQHEGVLITGYDSLYVHILNPSKGITENILRKDASEIFAKEGNIFVGYLREL